MKAKIAFLVTSCVMVILLLLASCGQPTTSTTPTSTPSTTPTSTSSTTPTTTPTIKPTTTLAATTPKYGGTLIYRNTRDITDFDPYNTGAGSYYSGVRLWYETIVMADLTTDPNVFDFTGTYHPFEYDTGRLVESWETTDPQTWVLHVRKGIKWQDIAPVSGREFTAYDVEYSYHRQLGLGSGFTKPSPYIGAVNYVNIQSVTATDKYTVVFKLKEPDLETMRFVFEGCYDAIAAREAIEKWGNLQDWRRQIGTGPFILEDYVSGSSWTAVKNPNYWGYDKLYPQNRLPYLDEIKVLIIPDNATAYAALRTGKIDMLESVNWQQASALLKTNPELQERAWPQNGWSILMHVDTKPFDDIRIRKAMQMSLDLPTIAKTYYGGTVSSTIYGAYAMPGYYTPFDQWPQNVKEGFTYNPAGAKKLLADAGYPTGFKFTLTASAVHDLDFYQVLKSYLGDVGIEMNIQVMDNAAWSAYTTADKHVTMSTVLTTNINYPPMVWINQYTSMHYVFRGHIKDPTYDQMWNQVKTIVNVEQQNKMIIQMNDYATAQFYRITTQPFNYFVMWQPWLKGYSGSLTRDSVLGVSTRMMWIDQALKESMGH
jgi:peptide/nickel transport system substrate-binding protein